MHKEKGGWQVGHEEKVSMCMNKEKRQARYSEEEVRMSARTGTAPAGAIAGHSHASSLCAFMLGGN